MGKDQKVPDAWDDDDWEVQADLAAKQGQDRPKQEPQVPMTRAERLAKHAEEQRKLWESAEKPEELPFLPPTTNQIPLTTPFKPAVKVLTRKPTPQLIAKRDPVTGLDQLTLQDEEEEAERKQESPEEVRKRRQRELEEKQRRYEEARAKIFGDSTPSSGQSSPRTGTPPLGNEGRQNHRGRGRGRGGRGRDQDNGRYDRAQPSDRQSGSTRELYDPGYSPKPGFNIHKRGDPLVQSGNPSNTTREEDQVIREPRGPDSSGRGGFGFARRGREHG
ncbi:hypothetical protein C8A03DRAFT_12181 [Achaetomium macrosporum]|uniref:SUZ domain-containing protein n=1 Tax=Achaetomium macrosporum TaxID=79813 RepID=A0AAN7CGD8_9PEZI|nr:hypothetical protein C8A03DRAFT_12181 [Achaetomium macrosporum]